MATERLTVPVVTVRASGDAAEPVLVQVALTHGQRVGVGLPRSAPLPAAGTQPPLPAERYADGTVAYRLGRDRLRPRCQPLSGSIPD